MTLYFENDSILPIEGLNTFGISVKETDNPIGYFGTGLKYALAVLMREKCKVSIRIGNKLYRVTTKTKSMRGKDFDFVYLNDMQLPFTTELGKNWKLWQAYRELYSNCIDEDGTIGINHINPSNGTIIIVEGLNTIHNNNEKFLLKTEPKYTLMDIEVHIPNGDTAVYYKGIKVLDIKAKYNYNITCNTQLTEDRTLSYYTFETELVYGLVKSGNTEAITDIVSITDTDFAEANINYSSWSPDEVFMTVVSKLKKRSSSLTSYYNRNFPTFVAHLGKDNQDPKVQHKLKLLKKKLPIKPKEFFVAHMEEDYKLLREGICLNIKLLDNPKKLEFIALIAVYKSQGGNHSVSDIIFNKVLKHYIRKNKVNKFKKVS